MNNERYLIITNTGQGDICIPINADNAEVLTLLQSFMKDPNDLGKSFTDMYWFYTWIPHLSYAIALSY